MKHREAAQYPYLSGLAAITLTVFVLWAAKPVIVPLALASLLAFILSPMVNAAERLGLGRILATLLTLLVTGAVAAVVLVTVTAQITKLAEELPAHQAEIERKIERLTSGSGSFSRLSEMFEEVAAKRADAANPDVPVRVTVVRESTVREAIEPALLLLEPIATAGIVVVLMVFILLGQEDLRSRFLATLGRSRLVPTVRVLEESANRVGRFLLFQLLVNAGLGALLAVGLHLMGVPYAPLWGFLTAALRFIPYVGTWISLLLPLSMSFATSPDWQQPLMIIVYFSILDLITANVVEPLLFGHQTGVSPIALLVAAAFWAWVWGPIGLLLSTPLTVCLAVIGQHVAPLRTFGVLLGDKPGLESHVEYYQRVLAHGADAGRAVAVSGVASRNAAAVFDTVLIPAVAAAHADRIAGALTRQEVSQINEAVAATIAPVLSAREAVAVDGSDAVVLGVPAHDEAEELPLRMLEGIVQRGGGRFVRLNCHALPKDVVRTITERKPDAVVISSLPPEGLAQTEYLTQLIREHHPTMPIIVARWGGKARYDELLVALRKAGASYMTTSFMQTLAQLHASTAPADDDVSHVTQS